METKVNAESMILTEVDRKEYMIFKNEINKIIDTIESVFMRIEQHIFRSVAEKYIDILKKEFPNSFFGTRIERDFFTLWTDTEDLDRNKTFIKIAGEIYDYLNSFDIHEVYIGYSYKDAESINCASKSDEE